MALPRYRSFLGISNAAAVTAIAGNGTTVTYTAANNFTAGQTVTISGSTTSAYNLTNVTIASASSTQFTVTNAATGTTSTALARVTVAAGSTPVIYAPTDFIPVTNITPFDNVVYLTDQNWRGSMAANYGEVQGPIYSEIEFGGDVFPDTIGYPVAGIFGDYVKTGAADPYTHTIALLNSGNGQATPCTLTDFYGRTDASPARQYSGCVFHELDIKFSADGFLTYTAKASGFGSATTALPTPSFSTVTPFPAWIGTTSIGGSLTSKLTEGSISIKRSVDPIHTVDGSQTPYQIFQGPLEVSGSLMLVLEDDSDLTRYLTNTQPTVVINFASGTPASAGYKQVQFTMTKCAFTVGKIDRSKDYVELAVDFRAIANSTDVGASAGYSPMKVVISNAKATASYA